MNFKKIICLTIAMGVILTPAGSVFADSIETSDTVEKSVSESESVEKGGIDPRISYLPLEKGQGKINILEKAPTVGTAKGNQKDGFESKATKLPVGGGEYPYDPSFWNRSDIIGRTNCYAYALHALGHASTRGIQPGQVAQAPPATLTTSSLVDRMKKDFIKMNRTFKNSSAWKKPSSSEYKVSMVIAPGVDYHYYRQDKDAGFSHKPGLTQLTFRDASGTSITNPEQANRRYSYANYSQFAGWYTFGIWK